VRHTLGCLLARVRGRSRLEYLTEPDRDRQTTAVLTLMADVPAMLDELTCHFARRLDGERSA
jgi:hypothetical protein